MRNCCQFCAGIDVEEGDLDETGIVNIPLERKLARLTGEERRDDGTVASEDDIDVHVVGTFDVNHFLTVLGFFPAVRRLVFVVGVEVST